MFTCNVCGEDHNDGPICSVCKKQYDYACAGVTEGGFRKLGDRKNTWRCPQCKSGPLPSPGPTSSTPSQLDKMQEQLNAIFIQLIPLAGLIEDVKTIKSDVNDLKESLDMAHGLINNFSSSIESIEARITEVERVTNEIPTLQAEITRLNLEIDNRDQWARANNVEIKGIPQKKSENLYDIATKIGSLCDFAIKKEDINYIARIPTRVPNAEKPIIISFNNRYIKEELVASARRSKRLDLSALGFSTAGNVYINDHLTQKNKNLLSKAKALAKEKQFQYIWVKHSKIMARKSDTSPVFFIKCEKDLAKII